ncbi:MAG: lysine--tRNA ligase [Candidatus Buchananbacteria bacterium]|nr:lysine--tRNA ligase [Candidatus Buchananbacteria bacterium]
MADPDIKDEYQTRLKKLENLKAEGIQPYPEKFQKSQLIAEILKLKLNSSVQTAGRLLTVREMGKIAFCHLLDWTGKIQLVLKIDDIGKENFKKFVKIFDTGDFIGVTGKTFKTQKGELSILVEKFEFLGKALRPLPEKWHGLSDQEIKYRQRYLDLVSDQDTLRRFILRSEFIKALREFYWQEGFIEVETPTLMQTATGAAATPYKTHNNALDIDLVLRISHELPLKELISGGFEKIFELGKAFRNEGHDPSHLPEHTHLEHYVAYWNYEDNIKFTEKMFNYLFKTLSLPKKINIKNKSGSQTLVDFKTPWQRIDYVELIKKDTGLDILKFSDPEELRKELKKKKIIIEGVEKMSLATLVDNVYKKVSRPKLINPTILYGYPKFLQPLARVNNKDQRLVDQFQLVVNGWEIVKAYSELVDPIDQRDRFEQQKKARAAGDLEAMDIDKEFLLAMEHGMPPISGWGMGIDRLVTLLTQQDNLRDVVLFPLLRPEK